MRLQCSALPVKVGHAQELGMPFAELLGMPWVVHMQQDWVGLLGLQLDG